MRTFTVVIVVLMYLCGNVNVACSQGINFLNKDFSIVFEKAKREKKIVFIDVYTSWCGPCKSLSKNVFTNDSVGAYFNKNFICYKLMQNKDESSKELASKYNIKAFPTLLWIGFDGNELHRVTGYVNANDLLNEAKKIGTNQSTSRINQKWKNGEKTIENAQVYFSMNRDRNEFVDYFKSLSEEEKQDKRVLKLIIRKFNFQSKTACFEYVLNNIDLSERLLGKFIVGRYIQKNIEQDLSKVDSTDFNVVIDYYKNLKCRNVDFYYSTYLLQYYLGRNELNMFFKTTEHILKIYPDFSNISIYNFLKFLDHQDKSELKGFDRYIRAWIGRVSKSKNSQAKYSKLMQCFSLLDDSNNMKINFEKLVSITDTSNYYERKILEVMKQKFQ
ncbi:MAG: thioredoxin family protein [Bacteroidales bacterium]